MIPVATQAAPGAIETLQFPFVLDVYPVAVQYAFAAVQSSAQHNQNLHLEEDVALWRKTALKSNSNNSDNLTIFKTSQSVCNWGTSV